MTKEQQNWYSNKELFEMLEGVKNDMIDLRIEMKETKTLIRDYNGLRKTINDTKKEVSELKQQVETNQDNRKEYIGYIIAAISTLFLLLNYFK